MVWALLNTKNKLKYLLEPCLWFCQLDSMQSVTSWTWQVWHPPACHNLWLSDHGRGWLINYYPDKLTYWINWTVIIYPCWKVCPVFGGDSLPSLSVLLRDKITRICNGLSKVTFSTKLRGSQTFASINTTSIKLIMGVYVIYLPGRA